MRFAGEAFSEQNDFSTQVILMYQSTELLGTKSHQLMQQKPMVPGFNTEDLQDTPELPAGTPFNQNRKGNYILQPWQWYWMLPNGEQGPSQGPNTPIKNYGGQYMPDATQPTGYKHGPLALAPAAINGATTAIKMYGAYRTGKTIGETIRDPSSLLEGDKGGLGRVVGDMLDGKRVRMDGPTLRSPYHQ